MSDLKVTIPPELKDTAIAELTRIINDPAASMIVRVACAKILFDLDPEGHEVRLAAIPFS